MVTMLTFVITVPPMHAVQARPPDGRQKEASAQENSLMRIITTTFTVAKHHQLNSTQLHILITSTIITHHGRRYVDHRGAHRYPSPHPRPHSTLPPPSLSEKTHANNTCDTGRTTYAHAFDSQPQLA